MKRHNDKSKPNSYFGFSGIFQRQFLQFSGWFFFKRWKVIPQIIAAEKRHTGSIQVCQCMFASSELPRSTRILAWTRRMLQCPQEGISWWYMQWISLLLWQYFLCINASVLCTTVYVKHVYTYACIHTVYTYTILYLLSQPLRIYRVIVRCTNVTQWRLLRLQARWGYQNLVHELLKQELRVNIRKVCYPCLYAYMRINTIIDICVCIRLYCILLFFDSEICLLFFVKTAF